jgi:DNA-binding protein H-NS
MLYFKMQINIISLFANIMSLLIMNENVNNLLADSSISDLKNLIESASKLIEMRKEDELNNARIQVRELAASLGVTLEDLLIEPSKAVKKAEVKFRNTSNADETWTGRGKKPNWLKAALENGAKIEDFAV